MNLFVTTQYVDLQNNALALRPFSLNEFGSGVVAPTAGHIQKVNQLISRLQRRLLLLTKKVAQSTRLKQGMDSKQVSQLLVQKELAGRWIKEVEKVWYFYQFLFGQRQKSQAEWLEAADRIALDCYQVVYTNLGQARSIPSPGPFSYLETDFAPATFRRNVLLRRLGRQANVFPLIALPFHRLINPWGLGAIHHETSHNIQNDLGLWTVIPRVIKQTLAGAGLPKEVVTVWTRWHKEIWADLCAVLLGGPAMTASLIDVLSRTPYTVMKYSPKAVHPIPYLRPLISVALLRSLGFNQEAAAYERLWRQLYPRPSSRLPANLLQTFPKANRLVVKAICFRPYRELGDKSLVQVIRFPKTWQPMIAEAARRLASGTPPGILPPRLLVAAARVALDKKMAPPAKISANFYLAIHGR